MSGLENKVLECKECGSTKVQVKYEEDIRYQGDYDIVCLNCSNWEQGNGVPHSFKVLDKPILKEDISMNMGLTNIVECKMCGSNRVSKCYSEGKESLKCNSCGELEYHDAGIYSKFVVTRVNTPNPAREEDISEIKTTLRVSNMVSRCSDIATEFMVSEEIFTEQGIDEVVEDFKKALLSEHEQINRELLLEQEDRVVYGLVGADIVTVLHDIGRRDIARDPEKLKKVIDYLEDKLEIPWMEYVEAALDI